MAASSDLNIDHVAQLARLALTPREKAEFAQQLGDVLHHIEQLGKADVSMIEPTAHAFPIFNIWGGDEPQTGLSVEQALRNAPQQRQNMVVVPRVVE